MTQTFTGETIEDVLVQVRTALGENALILSTEESTTGGMSGFFGKRTIVVTARAAATSESPAPVVATPPTEQILDAIDGAQVTFPDPAIDISDPVAFSQILGRQLEQVRMIDPSPSAAQAALADAPSGIPPAAPLAAYQTAAQSAHTPQVSEMHGAAEVDGAPASSPQISGDEREVMLRQEEMARLAEEILVQRARTAPMTMPEEITVAPLPIPPAMQPDSSITDPFGLESPATAPRTAVPPVVVVPTTIGEIIRDVSGIECDPESITGAPASTDLIAADDGLAGDDAAAPSSVASRLDGALTRVQEQTDAVDVAPAIEALWGEMRRAGVSERNILTMRHSFAIRGATFETAQGPRKALRDWIAEGAPVVRGLDLGLARTIALVGQTGVGKSTSACKLAGRHQAAGQSIGLIAAGRGPHAVLEHYAREMGLVVLFAETPAELARVHGELSDVDLVIVDTAGRSHRHGDALDELKEMLGAIPVDEVYLVTTIATGADDVETLAAAFRAAGADRLILTKLDESERTGNLINAPAIAGLPVGYLADGVNVPAAIFPATGHTVAEILLPLRRR